MDRLLCPSMMCANYGHLAAEVRSLDDAGADIFHCDIMDGTFVPNFTMGVMDVQTIRRYTDKPVDCHLMIVEPFRYINEFVKAGADSVTIHYEACREHGCMDSLKKIKESGAACGISIRPGTPLVHILPYLGMVDMVLLMSVEPGFGGQPFIPSTYDKLRELAALREEGGFDFDIEVDGGITTDNVGDVIDAGANVIVSGSSVFKGDIARNVCSFLEIFKTRQD